MLVAEVSRPRNLCASRGIAGKEANVERNVRTSLDQLNSVGLKQFNFLTFAFLFLETGQLILVPICQRTFR